MLFCYLLKKYRARHNNNNINNNNNDGGGEGNANEEEQFNPVEEDEEEDDEQQPQQPQPPFYTFHPSHNLPRDEASQAVLQTLLAHPLTNCFGRNVKMEAKPMNECMRKRVDNYCTSSATARISAPAPDYAGWMKPAIASNDTAFEQRQKSAFLRKTSAAFSAFHNFQKCLNNCAKKRSNQCFGAEGCAISLPSDRALAKLFYNQCTQQQNVPKNARDACYCMSTKNRVRDLVGVCPLFINRQLMQMS
ncbi:hypothetical protein niasHT_004441 [Heterodera trifolii]|uniref:Uncharacterized protein n=1 Tax=Heterodera trifolii TaxID=157864 RepID=A0ABD2LQC1_9BILA